MKIPSIPRSVSAFCLAGTVLMLVSAATLDAAGAQEKGPMSEKAMDVLESMSDYLSRAKALSVTGGTFFDRVQESGIKIKSAREVKVVLKRPNLLHAEGVSDDGAARTAWFDGKTLTIWFRHANQYMTLDFSGDTDALLDHLSDKYDVHLPLADLLYSDAAGTFKKNIISSEYLGERTVQGVNCHHLSFESTGADWQVWVQADSTPVPRRFAITYVMEKGEPEFLARLDNWSIDGSVKDMDFAASVPKDTKRIEFGKPGETAR